jgi:hypothetical protein
MARLVILREQGRSEAADDEFEGKDTSAGHCAACSLSQFAQ